MFSTEDREQIQYVRENHAGFTVCGKPGTSPQRHDLWFMPVPLESLCGSELAFRATCRANGISPQNPFQRPTMLERLGDD